MLAAMTATMRARTNIHHKDLTLSAKSEWPNKEGKATINPTNPAAMASGTRTIADMPVPMPEPEISSRIRTAAIKKKIPIRARSQSKLLLHSIKAERHYPYPIFEFAALRPMLPQVATIERTTRRSSNVRFGSEAAIVAQTRPVAA